jgi:prepilin-type N-terminal cleavage/methylation domain-containing protein
MHKYGLYGWFQKNLQGKKGQQGFTLIELLVVVTILGVLAAIVTLSLVGLTTNANTQSCNTEYKTVQAAIDAYMANQQLSAVPQQTAYTNDMSNQATGQSATNSQNGSLPLWVSTPSASNPNYTRNGTTQFFYTWDTSGKITSINNNGTGIGSDINGKAVANCVPK